MLTYCRLCVLWGVVLYCEILTNILNFLGGYGKINHRRPMLASEFIDGIIWRCIAALK